eukprot:2749195-Rhodomonas_salina.1
MAVPAGPSHRLSITRQPVRSGKLRGQGPGKLRKVSVTADMGFPSPAHSAQARMDEEGEDTGSSGLEGREEVRASVIEAWASSE